MANIIFYGGAVMGGYILYKYTKGELYDIPLDIYTVYRRVYYTEIFKSMLPFESHINIIHHEVVLDVFGKKWKIKSKYHKSEDLDNQPNHYLLHDKMWSEIDLVYIEYNIMIDGISSKLYKHVTSSQELDQYNDSNICSNWNKLKMQPPKKFINVTLHYNSKEYTVEFINNYNIVGNVLLDKKFIIFYMKKYFNISVNDDLLQNIKTTIIDGDANCKELNSIKHIKITETGYDII